MAAGQPARSEGNNPCRLRLFRLRSGLVHRPRHLPEIDLDRRWPL